MEARGSLCAWDEVVIRGDVAVRRFLAFWLLGGRVVGAMNANIWDRGKELAALVDSGEPLDRAVLADPGVPLVEVAA